MTHPETTENDAATRVPALSAPPPALPASARQTEPHYASPPAGRQDSPQARMPFLAAFFSAFPGLGNVYNGLYLRGVTFFLICFGLIGLAGGARVEERVLLIFSAIFVWFFNIFDAYRQATLINYGYSPDDELPVRPRISAGASGGLLAGVVVFAIGLIGLLRDYLDVDLTWLVDHWYILFMVFGGYMIVKTVLEKRRPAASTEAFDAGPDEP
jgi:hypothetical protein